MIPRTKWIERRFTFDFPEGWIFNILERLQGTALRLNEMTNSITEELAINKPENKWSIKEHIGHLADLEDLHSGRLDDFIARKEVLRAADMSNRKTHEANHNATEIKKLIQDFKEKRKKFILKLENLDDATQRFKSLHPRLKVLVRPVDIACFAAEHDDHHLADIREIVTRMKS